MRAFDELLPQALRAIAEGLEQRKHWILRLAKAAERDIYGLQAGRRDR